MGEARVHVRLEVGVRLEPGRAALHERGGEEPVLGAAAPEHRRPRDGERVVGRLGAARDESGQVDREAHAARDRGAARASTSAPPCEKPRVPTSGGAQPRPSSQSSTASAARSAFSGVGSPECCRRRPRTTTIPVPRRSARAPTRRRTSPGSSANSAARSFSSLPRPCMTITSGRSAAAPRGRSTRWRWRRGAAVRSWLHHAGRATYHSTHSLPADIHVLVTGAPVNAGPRSAYSAEAYHSFIWSTSSQ